MVVNESSVVVSAWFGGRLECGSCSMMSFLGLTRDTAFPCFYHTTKTFD